MTQAKIYLDRESFEGVQKVKGADYYERTDEDFEQDFPGYALVTDLEYEVLPEGTVPALRINTDLIDFYRDYVTFPSDLRGCIFENAPNLPEKYAETIAYWGKKVEAPSDTGAVYYQNPLNSYMVELPDSDEEGEKLPMDALVSEGVVVHIKDLGELIAVNQLDPEQFIEIGLPVDHNIFGDEEMNTEVNNPDYEYKVEDTGRREHIFLKVSDILNSPDCQNVYINVLRYELMDYGYYY